VKVSRVVDLDLLDLKPWSEAMEVREELVELL